VAPIVSVIASIASAEANQTAFAQRQRNNGIINIDLWENSFDSFAIARREDCPACVQHNFEYLDGVRSGTMTANLCGRNALQVNPGKGHVVNLQALAERLQSIGKVSVNEYLARVEVDTYELTVFPDGRAIIKGTDDTTVARSTYAKYIGS